MADTGEAVVAWSGPLAGGGLGISARRFATDGVPLGDELVVEGPISSSQHRATSVTTTAGLAFVVAWDSDDLVWARRFDTGGAALGPSSLVSTDPVPPDTYLDSLGQVDVDASGAFEITWNREDTFETSIHYANRYGPDGAPQWSVPTTLWGSTWNQGMSVSGGGALVAMWSNSLSTALIGRHFRVDGTTSSDEVVLASTSLDGMLSDPRVAHLGVDPEEWVLVWTGSLPVVGRDVHGLLSPTRVFGDGFESGALDAWSGSSP